jgi:hypothetical protein
MIRSPLFRIIGAILIMVTIVIFLFRGALSPSQIQPTIHSTISPNGPKSS